MLLGAGLKPENTKNTKESEAHRGIRVKRVSA
jgi:hypothetical protein